MSGGTPTIPAAEYRRMMAGGNAVHVHSMCKLLAHGIEEILPKRRMNKLETAYASLLETMRLAGEITSWRHESVKLRLADRTWYTPDFKVRMPDGREEFHETKGFMRDDAAVKLKVAAEMYPEYAFRLVRRKRGAWVVEKV